MYSVVHCCQERKKTKLWDRGNQVLRIVFQITIKMEKLILKIITHLVFEFSIVVGHNPNAPILGIKMEVGFF